MSISTTELLGMVDAIYSAKDTNDSGLVEFATTGGRITYCKQVADALAATTSDAGFLLLPASPAANQIKAIKATLMPQDVLTADNSNYATLSLVYDDGANGTETTVASVTTKITDSGDWTAGNVVPMAISAAYVPAGKQLRFKIAKTGTGVAVPITTLSVQYENL